MRKSGRPILVVLCFMLMGFAAHAEEQLKKAKDPAEDLVKWQESEAGQFVFFAVLEGLYKDGVPKEVVDMVIDPPRSLDNKVKHSFVFQCDICHAAYEAFVLYSRRQTFQKSAGRDTFGKGVNEKIISGLKAEEASVRVFALGDMMRPWIAARVEQMKLSKEKQEELVATLLKFKGEARTKMGKLRKEDLAYKDWFFYGGCQACEAATEIESKIRKL
jgi:hypothetical protein